MARARLSFHLDTFWKLALLVLLLRVASGPTGLLAYGLIAAYGLRGQRQLVEALLLSWFITMANPVIMGSVTGGGMGRFLVILSVSGAAVLRMVIQHKLRVSHAVLATLVLGLYILAHAVLFSVVTPISVLKGLTWTLAMLSLLSSVSGLSRADFDLLGQHIFSFLVFLVALSLAIYFALPGGTMFGYSYLRGILGHSQAAGVLGGLVAVWAFGRLVSQPSVAHHRALLDWNIAFFVLAVAVVFLSGTRTGLLSIAATMIATLFVAASQGQQPVKRLIGALQNPLIGFGTVAVLLFAIVNIDVVAESLSGFLSKNTESANFAEAFAASRGGLAEQMLANIKEDPIIGLGFGIASDPANMVVQTVGGIPISAVIEKGITHLAVWEELGLLGIIFVIYWAGIIFSNAIRADLVQFALLFTIFLQNFGEATLFSPGGMGLLQLILLGYCSFHLAPQSRYHHGPTSAQVPIQGPGEQA